MKKLIIEKQTKWPFDIIIKIGEYNFLRIGRCAYSTKMKTLDDLYDAKGFSEDEKLNVQYAIQRQERIIERMVANVDVSDLNFDDLFI